MTHGPAHLEKEEAATWISGNTSMIQMWETEWDEAKVYVGVALKTCPPCFFAETLIVVRSRATCTV
jgi:hypothetical protein